MEREVRRVPATWKHPRCEDGEFIPLHEGRDVAALQAKWDADEQRWNSGLAPDYQNGDDNGEPWVAKVPEDRGPWNEYSGDRPVESDYMPNWPEAEQTHLQMYEDCTEGTPISPVMETPEALARWLADNNASAFGYQGASYEQWLATIRRGWAPSAVFTTGKGLRSGVEDSADA